LNLADILVQIAHREHNSSSFAEQQLKKEEEPKKVVRANDYSCEIQ